MIPQPIGAQRAPTTRAARVQHAHRTNVHPVILEALGGEHDCRRPVSGPGYQVLPVDFARPSQQQVDHSVVEFHDGPTRPDDASEGGGHGHQVVNVALRRLRPQEDRPVWVDPTHTSAYGPLVVAPPGLGMIGRQRRQQQTVEHAVADLRGRQVVALAAEQQETPPRRRGQGCRVRHGTGHIHAWDAGLVSVAGGDHPPPPAACVEIVGPLQDLVHRRRDLIAPPCPRVGQAAIGAPEPRRWGAFSQQAEPHSPAG